MSDFTNEADIGGIFSQYELDEGVDFSETGDMGAIVIYEGGYGEGGYGEGIYGGSATIVLSGVTTIWTNIGTP